MIDIATIDTNDPQQIGPLMDSLLFHLDVDQCCDFLAALYQWVTVRDAPTLPVHAEYMREFEESRQLVLDLTDPIPQKRADA